MKQKPKYWSDIPLWIFSEKHTLIENLEFLSREFYRKAQWHWEQKAKSKNVPEAVMHGTSVAHEKKCARLLKSIAAELKNLEINEEST